jgi:8-oxo-dGTP pyrophosphatase MutT (NUDIX family)
MLSRLGIAFRKRLPKSANPYNVDAMTREISAGGVVLRQVDGVWHVALIEPQKEDSPDLKTARKRAAVLCLPKGLVDEGEKAEAAAIREVYEETGIKAAVVTKIVDTKYVYVRTWGDGERVFKIVSFYLMRYVSGEIDDVEPEMRVEVKRALWVPLAGATKQMAYSGERKVVLEAERYVEANGLTEGAREKKIRSSQAGRDEPEVTR